MARPEEMNPCRRGCGKMVQNATNICINCRKTKCKTCLETFSVKVAGEDECSYCKYRRAQRARNYGLA